MLSCSTDRTVKLWDADPSPDGIGLSGLDEAEEGDDQDEDLTSSGNLRAGGLLSSRGADVPASEVSVQ